MNILSAKKNRSRALFLGLLLAVALPLVLSQRLVRSGLAKPIASESNAPVPDAAGIAQRYGKLPLRFEANQGQTAAPFYLVSGTVTENGVGLSGVTATLGGSQSGLRTTDSNGNYSFTVAGGASYTVTPSLLGFSFSSHSLTFNNLANDQTTANFAALQQNFVVTNANNHGAGSLRQAMLDANATAGLDTIVFNIPGAGVHTIDLQLSLPEITDPVVIDATTQPGYAGAPLVELNGLLAGSPASGFAISAGGSTIRGFAIGRFSNSGISLSVNGNNVIQGNYIGIDATGTLRRTNHDGISLSGSSNNLIGGTTPAARNVISANSFDGITVNGSGNQISGNFIGTNAAGTANLGNGINGVGTINFVGSPSLSNVIGGTTAGAGNLISGNQRGIDHSSASTLIQGNLIGTDVSGTLPVPNGIGILVFASNGLVGGTVPGARNIISGNSGPGVQFSGTDGRVEGNFIGTDITGTVALGNGGNGVTTGRRTTIGGTSPEARNIISANGAPNGSANVFFDSNGDHSTVQGNYIGTDVTGNVALNNPRSGVSIQSSSNVVGGLVPGAQNIISGNRVGIVMGGLVSSSPSGNTIQGNLIGFNALSTIPLPNSFRGVEINDAVNNLIGGTQNGAANKIGFSGGPGIQAFSGLGNVVRGNSIFSNAGLGLDLDPNGVTANDVGDIDTGANNLQNFPLLTSVSPGGGGTVIQGTLNSKPNTAFQIDFYSNAACDPSGSGEGGSFFDTTTVTTDANGNATINLMSSFALASARVLTATATDPTGNTSEYSPCDATNAAGSLQFSTASYNMLEEVGSAPITVIRTGGSKGTLSVNYSSADGTATAGSDYTAVSGTLVFGDGETSKTFNIPIVNDGVTEVPETALLTLSATDVEILGSQPSATLTILGNDTPLVLIAGEVSVPEATANAVVTVTLSAGTSQTVTVNFATQNDTAIGGVDFTPMSGSLTFSPGVTTQTISIPIINDNLDENDEDFGVVLSNPVNASIQDSGVVIITDDDLMPSVSISDVSVTEGNSGTVSAVFNLSLSTASGRDIIVEVQTANGTATAGSDYVARFSSVFFPRGQTAKTISVTVNGDTTNEPDETFFVNFTFVDFATAADSQGLGTIINDDGLSGGSLSLSQTNYSVNEGAGSATITVNRSGGSAGEARVNYATSNGSATAGQDYTSASGTLIFPDGVTTQTFNVNITNDATTEPDETINLTLTNAAGTGSLGIPTTAVLKIIDNDPPAISISDVIETEGNSSFFNAFLTVTLSGQTSQTVTVDYVTADGTATAGSDYQAGNGTVTFEPLQTVRVIAVRINGDVTFEPNETFNVNLSNPVNATISDALGVGTIVNDDQPSTFINFSQSFYSVGESGGLTTITVNRGGDLSGPATVDYATTDNNDSATVVPCSTTNGNASSRCDYTTAVGTLRFAAGESSKSFLVLISQDNYVEGAESLTLTLSNVTGNASLATPSTASLTITDDATEPSGNPIDTADAFVRQHYHDFLNREPDAAGLAFWTNQITECQQPGATCDAEVRRINVSAAFFLSIEFQETGYFAYRTYKSSYGNIAGTPVPLRFEEFLPDTQQIGKDVVVGAPGADQQLENNKVAYMQQFVARSRFTAAHPLTLTPAQFVDALFANAGVTPSAAERNDAIGEFSGVGNTADTTARVRALRRVADNATLKQQETNKAFVLMQYFGYLRRNPNDPPELNLDFAGYDFWLGKLNQFNGNFVDAEMVKAFIISSEYRQRFGP